MGLLEREQLVERVLFEHVLEERHYDASSRFLDHWSYLFQDFVEVLVDELVCRVAWKTNENIIIILKVLDVLLSQQNIY